MTTTLDKLKASIDHLERMERNIQHTTPAAQCADKSILTESTSVCSIA